MASKLNDYLKSSNIIFPRKRARSVNCKVVREALIVLIHHPFLPAKGKTVDANQEMLALGFCNIFGSFVRSMPATGSFTRTAVNNASGVKTPMGGVITGCLVLLACGLLTSTFEFIPKATLAAVIIVAMYYMFELRIFSVLWRTKSKIRLVSNYARQRIILVTLESLAFARAHTLETVATSVMKFSATYFAVRSPLMRK